jgi:energy-coupling factor transporter ATP-binding protein EcfA2
MNNDKARYDVFLSYNNRDRHQVENIARRLTELGVSVFLDRWYLVPGLPWPQHLEEILDACGAAAICLGPHGMGPWQQREQYLALDRQAKDPKFPVIPVLLPGADPPLGFLSLNTWVDFRQAFNHDEALTLLSAAIQGKPPGPDLQRHTATARSNICPYRGLNFFREEDSPFFFGRDAFIERLQAAVQRHSLVAVVGASGSGKSSVVRAGLVPQLRQGAGNQVWDIVTIVPGDRPLQSLAAAMVRLLELEMTEVDRLKEIAKLAESLLLGELRLRDVVATAMEKQPGTNRLMLIVDQFEELYTLTSDEKARERFIDELLEATTLSPLSVVLTLRGDFFDDVLSNRRFSDRIQDATVHISGMKREELKQAIENPARKVGLNFEPGLANRILDNVQDQPGNLPLLEFVLTELWNQRQDELLTHAAYEDMGEAEGAIATQAETAFAVLSPADQEIARRVFLQLVRPGGDVNTPASEVEPTRRRASFADLGEEAEPVVRKLADAHLLVTGRNEATGEEVVDLVHEALIKAWDRLRNWISEDLEFLRWREQMRTFVNVAAAKNYERNTLLRGPLLVEAKAWSDKRRRDLSFSEKRYIDASAKAARSRLVVAISLAVVSVIAFAGGLYYQWNTAQPAPNGLPTPAPAASPEASVNTLTDEEARIRLDEIRRLIGVTSLEMGQPRTVAIIGPAPPAGTLRDDQMKTFQPSGADSSAYAAKRSTYVSAVVQCVLHVAPDAKFVFIPARLDSHIELDLDAFMRRLMASSDRPSILLVPDQFTDRNAAGVAFRKVSSKGILVITSNPFALGQSNSKTTPLGEPIMTVGSVNLNGQRSRFSPEYKGLFWAPGEGVVGKFKDVPESFSGPDAAAALAAGVALRIMDRYPQLTPAQVTEIMRATSQAKAENSPRIVNLDAALSRLSGSQH